MVPYFQPFFILQAITLLCGCGSKPLEPRPEAATEAATAVAPEVAPDVTPEAAPPEGPSTEPAPAQEGPDAVVDIRLFGQVPVTAKPANVFDPMQATRAPTFEEGVLSLNPRETFDRWISTSNDGTLQFGVSLYEAQDFYPSLTGATVADIGAGYGNNLLAWKELLGPEGRLLFTEVDPNAARFIAYSAHQHGYADRSMVVQNTFDDPCLPVAAFDLVLLSQVHYHITIGPYPKNEANEALFRKKSARFFASVRRGLKDDKSLLIVIEGLPGPESIPDPQANVYGQDEAIRNIEQNGFKLVKSVRRANLWVASFSRG